LLTTEAPTVQFFALSCLRRKLPWEMGLFSRGGPWAGLLQGKGNLETLIVAKMTATKGIPLEVCSRLLPGFLHMQGELLTCSMCLGIQALRASLWLVVFHTES